VFFENTCVFVKYLCKCFFCVNIPFFFFFFVCVLCLYKSCVVCFVFLCKFCKNFIFVGLLSAFERTPVHSNVC
jgi:hypothetical protein